ncbi:DUF6415 family natural product biosynthesis protein [Streptomyces sp. NBC_00557]|uniref:DUF6415 family natural product biosynthesis protein n=1 Tax=Streptomyces sp. NBC_00557 TaxID=2975776 RepID=UPI002E806368|nr:DUF6415 family natural product biosynthesis protein [Streptomyces sp. NBC_00557]WUC39641.1 DUF6415 family natural product biosynthesis protein [Streptomyces sp. NBC_00557]
MTATVLPSRIGETMPRWTHSVEPARPPANAALRAALTAVRAWTPYAGDALLDDVGNVLDTVAPSEERVEELGQRLRGHLMQLVSIATTFEAEKQDPRAVQRIHSARQSIQAEMPGDYAKAVSHLRRMGWAVHELLELLVEIGCVKAPDSLSEVL